MLIDTCCGKGFSVEHLLKSSLFDGSLLEAVFIFGAVPHKNTHDANTTNESNKGFSQQSRHIPNSL